MGGGFSTKKLKFQLQQKHKHMNNKFYNCISWRAYQFLLISLCFLFSGPIVTSQEHMASSDEREAELQLSKNGKELLVEGYIPKGITEFEIRIESDRNHPVSSAREIYRDDPNPEWAAKNFQKSPLDTRYPVVDVALELGMDGVCVFEEEPTGDYIFGGPYFRDSSPLKKEIILPSHKLEHWENSLMLDHTTPKIEKVYLRKTFPVILREFTHSFRLLSEDWSGRVSLVVYNDDKATEIASAQIEKTPIVSKKAMELEKMKGGPVSRERLIAALDLVIADGLRRQNNNPASPTYGSLFAFYDVEAKLHRTSYWNWASTQYVKMVLDAIHVPEIQKLYNKEELIASADKIGRNILKYQVKEEGHPSEGSFLVIWMRRFHSYAKWIGTSDSGVMVRWALMPLYEATGDSTYLEASKYWAVKKAEMLDDFDVLPHFYRYDEDLFNAKILDETGWDPEGHAALYEVTRENQFRESGKKFMDKHMKVFQREDGLWHRAYDWTTKENVETMRMTRGSGWAMEGLLAMNRMYPDTIYLQYAEKMAKHLQENQNEDGSWSFIFDKDPKEVSVTEKGTPLWSLLFYQLYEATGKSEYLQTARKALSWCLENQYTGPDVEAIGGLVGSTSHSMVGIREYFPSSCAYTTGFFGMAILAELKVLGSQ